MSDSQDWKCLLCDTENKSSKRQCKACQTSRADALKMVEATKAALLQLEPKTSKTPTKSNTAPPPTPKTKATPKRAAAQNTNDNDSDDDDTSSSKKVTKSKTPKKTRKTSSQVDSDNETNNDDKPDITANTADKNDITITKTPNKRQTTRKAKNSNDDVKDNVANEDNIITKDQDIVDNDAKSQPVTPKVTPAKRTARKAKTVLSQDEDNRNTPTKNSSVVDKNDDTPDTIVDNDQDDIPSMSTQEKKVTSKASSKNTPKNTPKRRTKKELDVSQDDTNTNEVAVGGKSNKTNDIVSSSAAASSSSSSATSSSSAVSLQQLPDPSIPLWACQICSTVQPLVTPPSSKAATSTSSRRSSRAQANTTHHDITCIACGEAKPSSSRGSRSQVVLYQMYTEQLLLQNGMKPSLQHDNDDGDDNDTDNNNTTPAMNDHTTSKPTTTDDGNNDNDTQQPTTSAKKRTRATKTAPIIDDDIESAKTSSIDDTTTTDTVNTTTAATSSRSKSAAKPVSEPTNKRKKASIAPVDNGNNDHDNQDNEAKDSKSTTSTVETGKKSQTQDNHDDDDDNDVESITKTTKKKAVPSSTKKVTKKSKVIEDVNTDDDNEDHNDENTPPQSTSYTQQQSTQGTRDKKGASQKTQKGDGGDNDDDDHDNVELSPRPKRARTNETVTVSQATKPTPKKRTKKGQSTQSDDHVDDSADVTSHKNIKSQNNDIVQLEKRQQQQHPQHQQAATLSSLVSLDNDDNIDTTNDNHASVSLHSSMPPLSYPTYHHDNDDNNDDDNDHDDQTNTDDVYPLDNDQQYAMNDYNDANNLSSQCDSLSSQQVTIPTQTKPKSSQKQHNIGRIGSQMPSQANLSSMQPNKSLPLPNAVPSASVPPPPLHYGPKYSYQIPRLSACSPRILQPILFDPRLDPITFRFGFSSLLSIQHILSQDYCDNTLHPFHYTAGRSTCFPPPTILPDNNDSSSSLSSSLGLPLSQQDLALLNHLPSTLTSVLIPVPNLIYANSAYRESIFTTASSHNTNIHDDIMADNLMTQPTHLSTQQSQRKKLNSQADTTSPPLIISDPQLEWFSTLTSSHFDTKYTSPSSTDNDLYSQQQPQFYANETLDFCNTISNHGIVISQYHHLYKRTMPRLLYSLDTSLSSLSTTKHNASTIKRSHTELHNTSLHSSIIQSMHHILAYQYYMSYTLIPMRPSKLWSNAQIMSSSSPNDIKTCLPHELLSNQTVDCISSYKDTLLSMLSNNNNTIYNDYNTNEHYPTTLAYNYISPSILSRFDRHLQQFPWLLSPHLGYTEPVLDLYRNQIRNAKGNPSINMLLFPLLYYPQYVYPIDHFEQFALPEQHIIDNIAKLPTLSHSEAIIIRITATSEDTAQFCSSIALYLREKNIHIVPMDAPFGIPITHILWGADRVTEKAMFALSRGAYSIHESWLFDSIQQGQLLPIDNYGPKSQSIKSAAIYHATYNYAGLITYPVSSSSTATATATATTTSIQPQILLPTPLYNASQDIINAYKKQILQYPSLPLYIPAQRKPIYPFRGMIFFICDGSYAPSGISAENLRQVIIEGGGCVYDIPDMIELLCCIEHVYDHNILENKMNTNGHPSYLSDVIQQQYNMYTETLSEYNKIKQQYNIKHKTTLNNNNNTTNMIAPVPLLEMKSVDKMYMNQFKIHYDDILLHKHTWLCPPGISQYRPDNMNPFDSNNTTTTSTSGDSSSVIIPRSTIHNIIICAPSYESLLSQCYDIETHLVSHYHEIQYALQYEYNNNNNKHSRIIQLPPLHIARIMARNIYHYFPCLAATWTFQVICNLLDHNNINNNTNTNTTNNGLPSPHIPLLFYLDRNLEEIRSICDITLPRPDNYSPERYTITPPQQQQTQNTQ